MRGRDERGDRGDLGRRAERREDPHPPVTPPSARRTDASERADLADLPAALRQKSIAPSALILPLDDALEAIAHFQRAGRRLETWEGWVQLRDGGRARSLEHTGSFALPRDAERAAATAREGMQRAQARWARDPEYPGAALYFALTFAPVT
jgi:hypothetical protein